MSHTENTGYTAEELQYFANWAQMVEDDLSIIVPATKYDVSQDDRLLIPIISHDKIGFVNQRAEYVVEPKFDVLRGVVKDPYDVVKVGVRYSYGLPGWKEGQICTYERIKWGITDANGKQLFEPIYKSISVSDDKQHFTLQTYTGDNYVCNRDGKVIVDKGLYDYIDGFSKGYARVKIGHVTNSQKNSGNKWGIINTKGDVVLPVEYDNIWNFYNGKDLPYTTIQKNGFANGRFWFKTGSIFSPNSIVKPSYYGNSRRYGEFAGSYAQDVMGYDDETINDAFDGDPDAYWNID